MEFYSSPLLACTLSRVSIPNGMEFYKNPLLKLRDFQIVSIPNGMEFYTNTNMLYSHVS